MVSEENLFSVTNIGLFLIALWLSEFIKNKQCLDFVLVYFLNNFHPFPLMS